MLLAALYWMIPSGIDEVGRADRDAFLGMQD